MKWSVKSPKNALTDLVLGAIDFEEYGLSKKEIAKKVLTKILEADVKESYRYDVLLEFRDIGFRFEDLKKEGLIISTANARCSHGAGLLGKKSRWITIDNYDRLVA